MDKALDVKCPACGAAPGVPCINRKSTRPLVGVHARRHSAAIGLTKPQPEKPVKGVVRVVQFRALDNSLHDTFAAAQRHNTDTELTRWLDDWLADNMAHGELMAGASDLALALRAAWHITKRKEQP